MGALTSKNNPYPLEPPGSSYYGSDRKGKRSYDNPYMMPQPQFPFAQNAFGLHNNLQTNNPGFGNGLSMPMPFPNQPVIPPTLPAQMQHIPTFPLAGTASNSRKSRRSRRRRTSDDTTDDDDDDDEDDDDRIRPITQDRLINNPLPQPPRDVLTTTPWQNVLQNLPKTDEQLLARTASGARIPPSRRESKLRNGGVGIFRRSNSKKSPQRRASESSAQHDTQEGPVIPRSISPMNDEEAGILAGSSMLARANSANSALRGNRSMNSQRQSNFRPTQEEEEISISFDAGLSDTAMAMNMTGSAFPPPLPLPIPDANETAGQREPPVFFDDKGDLRTFLMHSPHRVKYRDKTYPTATHLTEAFKFLPDHPEISEGVRTQGTVYNACQYAKQHSSLMNKDWVNTILTRMEEAISLKFEQNAEPRKQLMDTRNAELIYSDASNEYWGSGSQGHGQNHLGKLLMRVRERLSTQGYATVISS